MPFWQKAIKVRGPSWAGGVEARIVLSATCPAVQPAVLPRCLFSRISISHTSSAHPSLGLGLDRRNCVQQGCCTFPARRGARLSGLTSPACPSSTQCSRSLCACLRLSLQASPGGWPKPQIAAGGVPESNACSAVFTALHLCAPLLTSDVIRCMGRQSTMDIDLGGYFIPKARSTREQRHS